MNTIGKWIAIQTSVLLLLCVAASRRTAQTTLFYVYDVDWSSDGNEIALASSAGVIVRDALTSELLLNMPIAGDGAFRVRWSPDGRRIAVAEWSQNIRIWNAENGQLVGTLADSTDYIQAIAWSADGELLFSLGFEFRFTVWDAINFQVQTSEQYAGAGRDLDIRPDGSSLAIALRGGVFIRDMTTGDYTAILTGYDDDVFSAAWSPDGNYLVSGGYDGTVRTWDFVNNRPLLTLGGNSEGGSVDWLAGNRITSRGTDQIARIWDANTGQLLYTSEPRPGASDWSPDGTQIAYANDDGTIEIVTPTLADLGTPQASLTPVVQLDGDDLRDLLSDPNCQRACYMGIEPGITTRQQVEDILSSNNIQHTAITFPNSGDASYSWIPSSPPPFVDTRSGQAGIGINVINNVVIEIVLPANIPITIVTGEYGSPSSIVASDFTSGYYMLYTNDGLAFIADDNSPSGTVASILLAAPEDIEAGIIEGALFESVSGCASYGSPPCLAPTATPTITPPIP